MHSDGRPFRFADLEGRLSEADRDLLSSVVFADEVLEEEKAAEQAIACLRSLKSQDPQSELAALRAQIKAAERQGDSGGYAADQEAGCRLEPQLDYTNGSSCTDEAEQPEERHDVVH